MLFKNFLQFSNRLCSNILMYTTVIGRKSELFASQQLANSMKQWRIEP